MFTSEIGQLCSWSSRQHEITISFFPESCLRMWSSVLPGCDGEVETSGLWMLLVGMLDGFKQSSTCVGLAESHAWDGSLGHFPSRHQRVICHVKAENSVMKTKSVRVGCLFDLLKSRFLTVLFQVILLWLLVYWTGVIQINNSDNNNISRFHRFPENERCSCFKREMKRPQKQNVM